MQSRGASWRAKVGSHGFLPQGVKGASQGWEDEGSPLQGSGGTPEIAPAEESKGPLPPSAEGWGGPPKGLGASRTALPRPPTRGCRLPKHRGCDRGNGDPLPGAPSPGSVLGVPRGGSPPHSLSEESLHVTELPPGELTELRRGAEEPPAAPGRTFAAHRPYRGAARGHRGGLRILLLLLLRIPFPHPQPPAQPLRQLLRHGARMDGWMDEQTQLRPAPPQQPPSKGGGTRLLGAPPAPPGSGDVSLRGVPPLGSHQHQLHALFGGR